MSHALRKSPGLVLMPGGSGGRPHAAPPEREATGGPSNPDRGPRPSEAPSPQDALVSLLVSAALHGAPLGALLLLAPEPAGRNLPATPPFSVTLLDEGETAQAATPPAQVRLAGHPDRRRVPPKAPPRPPRAAAAAAAQRLDTVPATIDASTPGVVREEVRAGAAVAAQAVQAVQAPSVHDGVPPGTASAIPTGSSALPPADRPSHAQATAPATGAGPMGAHAARVDATTAAPSALQARAGAVVRGAEPKPAQAALEAGPTLADPPSLAISSTPLGTATDPDGATADGSPTAPVQPAAADAAPLAPPAAQDGTAMPAPTVTQPLATNDATPSGSSTDPVYDASQLAPADASASGTSSPTAQVTQPGTATPAPTTTQPVAANDATDPTTTQPVAANDATQAVSAMPAPTTTQPLATGNATQTGTATDPKTRQTVAANDATDPTTTQPVAANDATDPTTTQPVAANDAADPTTTQPLATAASTATQLLATTAAAQPDAQMGLQEGASPPAPDAAPPAAAPAQGPPQAQAPTPAAPYTAARDAVSPARPPLPVADAPPRLSAPEAPISQADPVPPMDPTAPGRAPGPETVAAPVPSAAAEPGAGASTAHVPSTLTSPALEAFDFASSDPMPPPPRPAHASTQDVRTDATLETFDFGAPAEPAAEPPTAERQRGGGGGSRSGQAGQEEEGEWLRFVRAQGPASSGARVPADAAIGDRDIVVDVDMRALADTRPGAGDGKGNEDGVAGNDASPPPSPAPPAEAPGAATVDPSVLGPEPAAPASMDIAVDETVSAGPTASTAFASDTPVDTERTGPRRARERSPSAPADTSVRPIDGVLATGAAAVHVPRVDAAPQGTPASRAALSIVTEGEADGDGTAGARTRPRRDRRPARPEIERADASRIGAEEAPEATRVETREEPIDDTQPVAEGLSVAGSEAPVAAPANPLFDDAFWAPVGAPVAEPSPVADAEAERTATAEDEPSEDATDAPTDPEGTRGFAELTVVGETVRRGPRTQVSVRAHPVGAWMVQVDDLMRAEWTYPPELRALGVQGTAVVRFRVRRDGVVEDVRLERGTGVPELDAAALFAVPSRVVAPPPGAGPQQVRYTLRYRAPGS